MNFPAHQLSAPVVQRTLVETTPFHPRCPLHNSIRHHKWDEVLHLIDQQPDWIRRRNRMGWSSLILAVYHQAPTAVIERILRPTPSTNNSDLLALPVPNGSRLCLHFAARYTDDLATLQSIVEGYPAALLQPSADGVRAVERAQYYDKSFHSYLVTATAQEQARADRHQYNQRLRRMVALCCARRCCSGGVQQQQTPKDLELVLQLYRFAKEREQHCLFGAVLEYVGVVPSVAVPKTNGESTLGKSAGHDSPQD